MTSGCETWALNNAMMDNLAVTQRKVERIILGITLQDQKQNTWICQETGVSDIINTIREAKRRCAGHIAWLFDNHWTIRATDSGPNRLEPKTGSSKNKTERRSHQTTYRTLMAKISQAQTPVGSIQGGVE